MLAVDITTTFIFSPMIECQLMATVEIMYMSIQDVFPLGYLSSFGK